MSRKIPVYSPSKLNLFQRCPYAYWRRYVDRSMPTTPSTLAQIRGAVTHQILHLALSGFRDGAELPEDVSNQAADLLSKYPQLAPDDIVYEAYSVSELASFALNHFDTRCEVIMVEDNLDYWHDDRFRLAARADAILRYPDGTFEVIDWKTGNSVFVDRIQTLLLYIGALTRLKREFGATPEDVRVKFAFLNFRQYNNVPVDRESSQPVWREVKDLIRSIQRSRQWPARENPLCEYCPLYGNGCPLEGPNYLEMDPADA